MVATRDPLEVLRTSGSAPKLPIRMTLFRLRLTVTSGVKNQVYDGEPRQSIGTVSCFVNQRYAFRHGSTHRRKAPAGTPRHPRLEADNKHAACQPPGTRWTGTGPEPANSRFGPPARPRRPPPNPAGPAVPTAAPGRSPGDGNAAGRRR